MRTENMTDLSRMVFRLAEKRARQLGATAIEPEHVLMGLLAEETGVAGVVLRGLGATQELFLSVLPAATAANTAPGALPWSEATDLAVERAYAERQPLNHNYVGTEHLLLGLALSGAGKVPELLRHVGSPELLKREVYFLLGHK